MDPTEPPYTRCHLTTGYDGVLRVRAAPRLVLTPKRLSQPPLDHLEDWKVQVGGECRNVAEPLPCRLEWIIHGALLTPHPQPHPRETWIVPKGNTFLIQEKDATGLRPLRVSALEFNLIGEGRLGYRIEPSVFGNDPVEVLPPHSEALAFSLKAELEFSALTMTEEIQKGVGLKDTWVGSVLKVEPDFCALFRGLHASLALYPQPPEGLPPDALATVRLEWTVGDVAALSRLLWKVGFASVPGDYEGTWNEDHLLAVGGVESSPTIPFQYQLTISRPPPPAPPASDKDKKAQAAKKPPEPVPQLTATPQPAVTVERPRLKFFRVWLRDNTLGVEGEFKHFHEDVALPLRFKPFVLEREGSEPRVEELDDQLRRLLLERLYDGGDHTRGAREVDLSFLSTCSEDDIQTRLAALEQQTVTVSPGEFRHSLFDLGSLPHEILDAFEKREGLELFVSMTPAAVGLGKDVPFWALADYEVREAGESTVGFAPFDSGDFVSRVFASGVCTSNIVTPGDSAWTASKPLRSPVPVIPADRRQEFEVFFGTVCGESVGQSPAAWAGVAHTLMNRVGRKFETWESCLTVAEIAQRTGFEAYQKKLYQEAVAYLRAPANSALDYRDKLKRIIDLVTPIFMRRAGDLHGVVYFYSPAAQRKLGRGTPKFVNQGDGKDLVRVTELVAQSVVQGKREDDFEFYAFKFPEKWPQRSQAELRQALHERDAAKGRAKT